MKSLTRTQTPKVIRFIALLLCLAALAWFNSSPSKTPATHAAAGSDLVGRVVAVADGDTLTVLDAHQQQHRIRLMGIDAPEKQQAFGQRARDQLAQWVFEREVRVESTKTDRYRRILGKVWVEEREINRSMIEAGMAWYYTQFSRDLSPEDRRLYEQAEQSARQQQRGLWADPQPQAPWDFRRQQRTASTR